MALFVPWSFDPTKPYLTNILSDDASRAYVFGAGGYLTLPGRAVAAKTGTTNDYRDAWTMGYTPSLATGIWVGNNDNTPMSYVASGITGASPIWRKTMDKILENQPIESFPQPEEIKEVYICSLTGTLTCGNCPTVRKEYFLSGTEPKISCSPEKIKEILDKKNQPTPNPQIL